MAQNRIRPQSSRNRGRALFIASFLAPAVALYGLFVVLPVIQAFQFSMYEWRGISDQKNFVGLQNFKDLFTDNVFWLSLEHNLLILVGAGALFLGVGMLVAHALQGEGRISKGMRSVYLFPQMISLVVVAVLWQFIYNPSFGLLTPVLKLVGLGKLASEGIAATASTALPAVAIAYVWYGVGFYIMVLSAGIRGIPSEVQEAATLDGAKGFQRFREITLPQLWAVMRVSVVYIVIHAVNIFALVFLMTQGGPDRKTEVMLTYLYERAFVDSKFGFATALAVANFIVVMALSGLVMRLYRKDPTGVAV